MRLLRFGSWSARFVLGLACASGFVAGASAANPKTSNPSHADPALPLAVHGDELSTRLYEEGAERAAKIAKLVPVLVERDLKGHPEKNDPDDLAAANTAIAQLERIGRQLLQLGEPCGYEFGLRVSFYRPPLNHAIEAFANSGPGMQHRTKVRQLLARGERERAATLKKLNDLASKQQYEEAERTWHAFNDKLRESTAFLPSAEIPAYAEPFVALAGQISDAMETHRSAAGKALLQQRRDAQRPQIAAFTAAIGATAQALAKSERVELEGAMLTGPEAFAYYLAAWQKMHAAAVRSQGLTWTLNTGGPRTPGMGVGATTLVSPDAGAAGEAPANDPALEEYRQRGATAISQALAGLVAAEATRVGPAEVSARYLAWLDAAAPHVGRVQGNALAQALEPALAQLAARSPEFLAQVQGYDEATREYLRWKRRSAEAASAPFVAQQPALETALRQAFKAEPNYAGLFPPTAPESQPPTFFGAAPLVLPYGAERLLKKSVILQGGQGLAGGKSNVTRLAQRSFATMKPNPEAVAAAVATLETELFAAADRPPLTLTAAAALRSLQLGDFVTAGGEATGVHLEGFLARVAGLPDAAWPLYPLGELPAPVTGESPGWPGLARAAVRVEIEPKWLRHEYVIVPLSQ